MTGKKAVDRLSGKDRIKAQMDKLPDMWLFQSLILDLTAIKNCKSDDVNPDSHCTSLRNIRPAQ